MSSRQPRWPHPALPTLQVSTVQVQHLPQIQHTITGINKHTVVTELADQVGTVPGVDDDRARRTGTDRDHLHRHINTAPDGHIKQDPGGVRRLPHPPPPASRRTMAAAERERITLSPEAPADPEDRPACRAAGHAHAPRAPTTGPNPGQYPP